MDVEIPEIASREIVYELASRANDILNLEVNTISVDFVSNGVRQQALPKLIADYPGFELSTNKHSISERYNLVSLVRGSAMAVLGGTRLSIVSEVSVRRCLALCDKPSAFEVA